MRLVARIGVPDQGEATSSDLRSVSVLWVQVRFKSVNRTEIELTRFLFDILPTDVQTHAGEMWVRAHLSFEVLCFLAYDRPGHYP